jgi:RHS repeat-associated protein
LYSLQDPIDGDSGDTFAAQATDFGNALGTLRFGPQEDGGSGPTKTRRNLGSYNYSFAAPVLGLGGRGVEANLALTYNSRTWNKDGSAMTFNYNKGWPAAGWNLGYGRIIENYDNTATGDATGHGTANKSGNYLLIQPDGSRIHLSQVYDTVDAVWKHDSTDGTYLHFTFTNKLEYPDGTVVKYSYVNNRLLPTSIRSRNGDLLTIAYRNKTTSFKFRWAIDYITDSLGRVIRFYYDATTGVLTSITAPDFAGGASERTLVKLDYQTITLQYNFGSLTVNGPTSGTQLSVLRRIYYPQTGLGYLFLDYSTYGMARRISTRKDMTGAGGAVTDGTEIGYTKYYYTTIDASDPYARNQVGSLNDSPQYTKREEWWQGKTDANGTADSTPSVYTYSRTAGAGVEIDTVTYPNGMQVATTTDSTPSTGTTGFVLWTEYKNSVGTLLGKTSYTYASGPGGGMQVASVENLDEGTQRTRTEYGYGSYGRLSNVYEYGYTSTVQRRTRYQYSDTADHTGAGLLRLVTDVSVYDSSSNKVAKTVYTYDDYAVKGGMEYYGLTSASYPPNHDANFDQTYTRRGNVTGVQTWSNIISDISTTRYTKYDIFGNAVEADVSCCLVKYFGFSSATYYSQPDWARQGSTSGPNLTNSFQYNFSTGLLTQATDPDGLITTTQYDSAWRLSRVDAPSGAYTTTSFDRDGNGNDQLAYSQQANYTDNGVGKVVTTKSWLDGAGRVLRTGVGTGASPSSFDTSKMVYDSMGRAAKQSNPYAGDSSGNGTPLYWTTNTYDPLSRVTTVTLPDNQTIQTSYTGSTATSGTIVVVTDQVGRKRQSEVDGLGRVVKVVEQNPSTGLLDATNYLTSYSYDTLNNLTLVNQGGQTRSFQYDAMSRKTAETTPEAGTVSYTYTSFDQVSTRTDARGAATTYNFDALNRLSTVAYNTTSAPGVATTAGVTINYKTTSPGKGQVDSISDAAGSVTYGYDSQARVSSKTRTIDARSYQTQYIYNTAGQAATLVYPSGKCVRVNTDARGRMSGLDSVDTSGNVLSNYIASTGYNTAGQVTSVAFASGTNESYSYSADRLQMTSQSVTAGATTWMSLTYGYQASAGASGTGTTAGNNGQVVSVTGTVDGQSRAQAFTYDNMGRLMSATGWATWARRYAYDRWGNRTGMWDATSGGTQLQNIAVATTSSVANNRIASVNGVSYSHDASGGVTGDGAHSYTYDAEGRQVSVDGGTTVTSVYDSANQRVKKVAAGVTTHYVLEGSQVIAEYNGSTGALVREYVYAGNRMVAKEEGGGTYYIHQDRVSMRIMTNQYGGRYGTQDHLPFGEDASTFGGTDKRRFTTYERDTESNTDYAVNRQYQMANGKFMQPDPILGNPADPQSLNRYSYVTNDPLNFADPLGLNLEAPGGGTTCTIDWMPARCSTAFRLLDIGAAVEYNGSPIINIGGSFAPVRFDPHGNLIATIRVAKDHPLSGTISYDENGETILHIGVLEKTINVVIPFGALPIGLRYKLAPEATVKSQSVEMLVGPSIMMAAPFAGLLRLGGAASAGGGAVRVNLGGEGEITGVINQQGRWVLDKAWRSAHGESLKELQAKGNQFVISNNTNLPFRTGSVDQVFTNGVPVNINTWMGPGVQSSEIWRILRPSGQWVNNGAIVPKP